MVLRPLSLIVLFSFLTIPSVGRSDDKAAKKASKTDQSCCAEKADGKSAMDCKDMAASKDGKSCSEMEKSASKTKDAGKMDCCSEHGKVKNQKVKSAEPKGTK